MDGSPCGPPQGWSIEHLTVQIKNYAVKVLLIPKSDLRWFSCLFLWPLLFYVLHCRPWWRWQSTLEEGWVLQFVIGALLLGCGLLSQLVSVLVLVVHGLNTLAAAGCVLHFVIGGLAGLRLTSASRPKHTSCSRMGIAICHLGPATITIRGCS